jgi:hypothetical protein
MSPATMLPSLQHPILTRLHIQTKKHKILQLMMDTRCQDTLLILLHVFQLLELLVFAPPRTKESILLILSTEMTGITVHQQMLELLVLASFPQSGTL